LVSKVRLTLNNIFPKDVITIPFPNTINTVHAHSREPLHGILNQIGLLLSPKSFIHKTNRIEVIRFGTLQKQRYSIQNDYRTNLQGGIKIDAIQSIYMKEVSSILPFIIPGFYETFSWVKWKMDVIHTEEGESTQPALRGLTNTFDEKPCRINIQKLLIPFNYYTTLHIHNNNHVNTIPLCNKTDFIKIEVIALQFALQKSPFQEENSGQCQ